MLGLYTIVYTTIFSVLLGGVVTRTQNLKGFETPAWGDVPRAIFGMLIVVLVPVGFFVFALPAVSTFPTTIDWHHLVITLFWAGPAFGCQQTWAILAKQFHWVTDDAVTKNKPGYVVWTGWFLILVLLPVVHLITWRSSH